MRIVVTAGPTREYIDDVRFISNPSSGKMGYEVAAEAARRGHSVCLLSGPVCRKAPAGVRILHFESVDDLMRLAGQAVAEADCLVMAAAVGDYKPARRIAGKHKKAQRLELELVATTDVMASLAEAKGRRIFVGFAVESENVLSNALRKIESKGMDLLVLNGPESFGAETADFSLVLQDGSVEGLGVVSKAEVAGRLLDEAEALLGARESG